MNFATHDWIAHGSDANERYRSFARPAVFSHDRLTFTMAHHVSEQKSYRNCKLLLDELERVVSEELLSRERLISSGVRDVSHLIQLPPNLLEQLDEVSAEYDDKRLCHACKHVCFFSAVACECSQSKVSCLRHSHYMVSAIEFLALDCGLYNYASSDFFPHKSGHLSVYFYRQVPVSDRATLRNDLEWKGRAPADNSEGPETL